MAKQSNAAPKKHLKDNIFRHSKQSAADNGIFTTFTVRMPSENCPSSR
ncbi:hypothetical protein JHQ77_10940 [Neisseria meningitidis]|nr:hypothetical protein [Neisseria meningitidis]MCG3363117.1 hypothetical protein [Neisseria meningitidis]